MRPPPELPLTAGEQLELWLELLRRGVPVELRVQGPCMRPWLFSGDRLRVEPSRGPLRRGTVVLVRDGDTLLAHRVVAASADRVWTRGDLSSAPDPPWRREQVLGRIVSATGRLGVAVPLGGRVVPLAGLAAAPVLRALRGVWRRRRR